MTLTAAPPQPPSRRRSAGRRFTTMLGVLLIVGGLGLLGWFAWQYFGTNIVAKQKQAEIKEATVAQWKDGLDGDAVALLRVDRFGKDFEVPIVEGFDDAALARGVGMYEKAAQPGEIGNFAIAGHRVTHGEPFRDFLKLRKGDEVEVETRTKVFVYELENAGDAIKVDFTVSWPLWKVPSPDASGEPPEVSKLTMLTCSELFHTNDRNIVVGDLVETIDKATTEPPADRAAEPSPDAKSP
ncbi:MAG: sortase [Aeromicrobium sp.]|uniref:sortase n=1 Tax=Aeromicrobium sp. TaxID=1871063 RepID=UPI003C41C57D